MRIFVDIAGNNILQATKDPEIGDITNVNGKYIIDTMGNIELTNASYLTPRDGGDVASLAYGTLLNYYPYSHVQFDPLIASTDTPPYTGVSLVNPPVTPIIPGANYVGTHVPRFQSGTTGVGLSQGTTAILTPSVNTVALSRPGLLISNLFDITADTGGLGAVNFMVYWKIYTMSTSEDVTSNFGATIGLDTPCAKNLTEINQSPAGFYAAISFDNGLNFEAVNRLTAVTSMIPAFQIRLAFANISSSKIYIGGFALLF
jgi:hypothetical protein